MKRMAETRRLAEGRAAWRTKTRVQSCSTSQMGEDSQSAARIDDKRQSKIRANLMWLPTCWAIFPALAKAKPDIQCKTRKTRGIRHGAQISGDRARCDEHEDGVLVAMSSGFGLANPTLRAQCYLQKCVSTVDHKLDYFRGYRAR